ncbi:MAG: ribonuclease H-like domain-containing protein [Synergistaceae bacterium]|jgi:uncharacterized protein YprB with RNaseH-like and TPR domain|nr:ribonuclease H-like domain-containing protein [Synergistaceae bacterium]
MGKFDKLFGEFGEFGEDDSLGASVREPARVPVRGLSGGSWVDDGVYRIDSRYPLGSLHGEKVLARPEEMGVMDIFGARGSVVFLDLETTGLAGGTGTYAFLCGLGFSSGSDFTVVQFFLEGPSKESRWLSTIDSVIPEDSCLVTYNGASFDLPLLRARHVLARSRPVWDGIPHIDLLRQTRAFYRDRLESCSLGSMERNIIGVTRHGEDIPGRLIPEIYMQYLKTRDASPLEGVFYHNEIDIVSLAALYCHVARLMEGMSQDGADLVKAGDIWMAKGERGRALSLWDKACEMSQARAEAFARKGFMAKRAKDFKAAKDAFLSALGVLSGESRRAADVRVYVMLEELAKIEEHRFKSPESAMSHVETALDWLRRNRCLLGNAFAGMNRSMARRAERLMDIMKKQRGSR